MMSINMRASPPRHRESGFSLIEIMVGLVIGMMAIVIMLQMLSNADANKRNTVGGNDAQMNTSIALYNLEREIRTAGYGLSNAALLGCTLAYTPTGESATVTLDAIAPIVINPATTQVPAGDANTDTLLVMYGSSDNPAEGRAMTSTSTSTSYTVSNPSDFTVGDFVIAEALTRPTPPNCTLKLSKVTGITGASLTVSNGVASLPVGSVVFNLGRAPVIRAYAIRKGILTMCDYTAKNCGTSSYATTPDPDVWVPVASSIVSLRAQYGRDTSTASSMTGIVSQWDQANPLLETATGASTASPPIHCARARIVALRMALVVAARPTTKSWKQTGPGQPNLEWLDGCHIWLPPQSDSADH
jgi:type IV pilus assembly protein PilW